MEIRQHLLFSSQNESNTSVEQLSSNSNNFLSSTPITQFASNEEINLALRLIHDFEISRMF
jgi:hypothetical protein